MEQLKSKLRACAPERYKLHWEGNEKSPIRYKTTEIATRETGKKLAIIWADAVTKITNQQQVDHVKYIRVNIPHEGNTVTITIFPTGNIMFQGNSSYKWADRQMKKICKETDTNIKKHEHDLYKGSESEISSKSISVKGACVICDQEDDYDMVECENCLSFTHHLCAMLSEEQARKMKFYCKFCIKRYNLKNIIPPEYSKTKTDVSRPTVEIESPSEEKSTTKTDVSNPIEEKESPSDKESTNITDSSNSIDKTESLSDEESKNRKSVLNSINEPNLEISREEKYPYQSLGMLSKSDTNLPTIDNQKLLGFEVKTSTPIRSQTIPDRKLAEIPKFNLTLPPIKPPTNTSLNTSKENMYLRNLRFIQSNLSEMGEDEEDLDDEAIKELKEIANKLALNVSDYLINRQIRNPPKPRLSKSLDSAAFNIENAEKEKQGSESLSHSNVGQINKSQSIIIEDRDRSEVKQIEKSTVINSKMNSLEGIEKISLAKAKINQDEETTPDDLIKEKADATNDLSVSKSVDSADSDSLGIHQKSKFPQTHLKIDNKK